MPHDRLMSDPASFRDQSNWTGGFYELAIEVGSTDDAPFRKFWRLCGPRRMCAEGTDLVEEDSARLRGRVGVRGGASMVDGDEDRPLDDVRVLPAEKDAARQQSTSHLSRTLCRHHASACHERTDAANGSGRVRRRNSASSGVTFLRSPARAAGASRRSASARTFRASAGSQQGQEAPGR